jgi:restriction endonuclease
MKFTFKIQKYQTEAVDSLVKCFEGQQFADKVQYLRDKGLMPKIVNQEVQTELFDEQMLKQVLHDRHSELDSESFEDSDNGYRNAELVLSEKELLDNIHKIRFLYCYPDVITDALIDEIATNPKIIKYMDIPLQH